MMINYKEILEKYNPFEIDEKLSFANWFYSNYKNYTAQDIYCWLWSGEFGYYQPAMDDLNTLREDIRKAKIQPSKIRKIWEPLGISKKFVKINLDLYFDAGLPLKRLLSLIDRIREFQNVDKLTFKNNWNLMKIQVDFTQKITLKEFNEFQEKIAFHMTPFYPFTEEFLKEFGYYYRIVPLEDFFLYYPEYINDYEEIFIDIPIIYKDVETT